MFYSNLCVRKSGRCCNAHFQPEQRVVLNDPNIWDTIIDAMQKVISSGEGTAHHFGRDAPYPAAGKTGTAQVVGRANGEVTKMQAPQISATQ